MTASRHGSGGRPCTIGVYPDGPYVVRGAFEVVDASGRRIDMRRRTIALCRCGRSRTAPICDGTHKVIGFSTADPGEAGDRPDAAAGGAGTTPSDA
jgi:CDGSH-type Zn-finger protein